MSSIGPVVLVSGGFDHKIRFGLFCFLQSLLFTNHLLSNSLSFSLLVIMKDFGMQQVGHAQSIFHLETRLEPLVVALAVDRVMVTTHHR